MIETVMLIALGFFVATVLALLVLPLVARRAARLAALRLEETSPLSPDEIAAERDGLRAVSAVEQRRLEQKFERAAAAAADGEAKLGRRTVELASLEEARAADRADRMALAADLERTQRNLTEAGTRRDELDERAKELAERLRETDQDRRAVLLKRDEYESLAEERRATIAGLETQRAGLEMRLGDRDQEIERGASEQQRLLAALNDTSRERDLSRKELLLATTQRSMLQDDVASLTRRADSYRVRLEAKAEALTNTERKLMTETADRKVAETAFADLKRRFEMLEARLIEVGGSAVEALVDSELDALRASITSVADDALTVLGRHGGPHPAEAEQSRMLHETAAGRSA